MIINCNKCSTKYLVPDTSIGHEGRNVKCAKCGYIWLEKLPQELNQEKFIDDNATISNIDTNLNNTAGLPAVIKNKNTLTLCITAILQLILICFSVLVLYNYNISKIFPKFASYFNYLYINDNIGLDIKDLKFDITINDSQKNIDLQYNIFNSSNHKKKVTAVKISLLDDNKNEINSYISKGNIIIEPNGSQPVNNTLLNISSKTHFISIKFKNNLDSIL